MNAVIYARYSSDRQNEESIEAQVRACRDYAKAHNITVVSIYADEAISGKGSQTSKRMQYQKMLRDAEKHLFNTILIHKYDRIARNLGEHVNLEQKLSSLGVSLIATAQDFGNTNEAKIVRALMWSLSEYYIDNLSTETKKGLRETALKGLHNGGYPPFGYDVIEQKYIINTFEAYWVQKIFDAAKNRLGFTDLLSQMEGAGVRGKRGKILKYTQIYEILRNEKYTGTYSYSMDEEKNRADRRKKPNAIRIENAFPAIIDMETFKEVQKIMDERKHVGKQRTYLCSGLVYCSCGAKMHAAKSQRKGHTYYYYACSKKCGAKQIRMEKIDDAAYSYLNTLLSEPVQIEIMEALRKYTKEEKNGMKDFNMVLQKKIKEKEEQYASLLQNLSSGALPASVLSDIGEKMESLKSEIETLKNTEPPKEFAAPLIFNWLDNLKKNSPNDAVRLLIERIEIKNTTDFKMHSTLNSVVGEIGCGGTQHILPKILFRYEYKFHTTDAAEGWCM